MKLSLPQKTQARDVLRSGQRSHREDAVPTKDAPTPTRPQRSTRAAKDYKKIFANWKEKAEGEGMASATPDKQLRSRYYLDMSAGHAKMRLQDKSRAQLQAERERMRRQRQRLASDKLSCESRAMDRSAPLLAEPSQQNALVRCLARCLPGGGESGGVPGGGGRRRAAMTPSTWEKSPDGWRRVKAFLPEPWIEVPDEESALPSSFETENKQGDCKKTERREVANTGSPVTGWRETN